VCIFVIYIELFPYCLFVSNSQVIGCEDCLLNNLYCVGWGVKLYSIQSNLHCNNYDIFQCYLVNFGLKRYAGVTHSNSAKICHLCDIKSIVSVFQDVVAVYYCY